MNLLHARQRNVLLALLIAAYSTHAEYAVGIQYNISVASIPTTCEVCLNDTYSTPLNSLQLQTCSAEYLFIGASSHLDSVRVGAYVNRFVLLGAVTNAEQNASGPFNEVYWYHVPGIAVGFAPSPLIQLNPCDVQSPSDEGRMSWVLDGSGGGCRAGSVFGLEDNSTHYRKLIYACAYNGAAKKSGALNNDDYTVFFLIFPIVVVLVLLYYACKHGYYVWQHPETLWRPTPTIEHGHTDASPTIAVFPDAVYVDKVEVRRTSAGSGFADPYAVRATPVTTFAV